MDATQFPTPAEALALAIEAAGGVCALARICKVSHTAVQKWRKREGMSAGVTEDGHSWVILVERATGVSRHWLRPDIYPIEHRRSPRFHGVDQRTASRTFNGAHGMKGAAA
jgi:DNA-binding transcriptional regulator YdaS (Cro superfamily)